MASGNGGVGVGGNCGESESSDSLRTFGAVLKALRDEARLTQEQFAPLVQYSAAYIAKIEQGKRFPPRDLLDRSEEVLGPTAGRVLSAASRSLTRKVGLASWFLQWAAAEEDATSLYAYECRVIPGLLQPEPYIHALFERHLPPLTEEQSERQVAARLARHHLLLVGRYRNVEIQVMPLVQEDHAGFEGEMYLAETADHRWAGYVEGHGTSM